MATTPQPVPNGGGAPDAGGSPSPAPPSQGQPSSAQVKLAMLYQACKQLAQENPQLAAGLSKAAQAIQEAATSLATQPQPQPAAANPPY